MLLCLSPSLPACVLRPCLECVHASEYELRSILSAHDLLHLAYCIVSWKFVCPCVSLCCVSWSPHACGPTILFRMCTCINTCNLCPPDCPCMLQPVCIVWWKPWVPLFATVHVSQSPCIVWSHTLFRMCTCIITCIYVHLTSHVCSTPYAQFDGNCWYPCMAVCLFPSYHHLCSHTLFRTCTCISTWIYVHLTVHVCSLPLCLVSWKLGCPCLSLCLCSSNPAFWSHTLFRMCTCISTWYLCPPDFPYLVAHQPMHSLMETWVSLYGRVFDVPVILHCVPTPCLECVHASVHEFRSFWLSIIWYSPVCIVWCQVECPCMAVCLCPGQPISDPTPCLECVHASVHEVMPTWLCMSDPSPYA